MTLEYFKDLEGKIPATKTGDKIALVKNIGTGFNGEPIDMMQADPKHRPTLLIDLDGTRMLVSTNVESMISGDKRKVNALHYEEFNNTRWDK